MGRPALAPGTPGVTSTLELDDGTWRARCKFRDYDGVTRTVARHGTSRAKAVAKLNAAIRDRQTAGGLTLGADVKAAVLLTDWLDRLDEEGSLSITTRQQYRKINAAYVTKAIGAYRLAELSVVVCDRALRSINREHGHAIAKSSRAVMSGALGMAVRQGALPANPMRDVGRLNAVAGKQPRALTPLEVDDLLDRLRTSERALALDLPDLVDFMMATGARIGEALACRDDTLTLIPATDLHPARGTWLIDATVIRVTGEGLRFDNPKSSAGVRRLALPPFAVDMLLRRQGEIRLRAQERVVFPSPHAKKIRDPSNCMGDLREVFDSLGYDWLTSHGFRKTVATMFDEAGQTARKAADQLGHAKPSMTQDVYYGRGVANPEAARILDR